MPGSDDANEWVGKSVFDMSGNEIGSVNEVHLSGHLNSWSFVTIETNLGHVTALPLKYGVHDMARLRVPYSADTVNNAPSLEGKGELTEAFRNSVTKYYSMHFGDLPGDPEVPYDPTEE